MIVRRTLVALVATLASLLLFAAPAHAAEAGVTGPCGDRLHVYYTAPHPDLRVLYSSHVHVGTPYVRRVIVRIYSPDGGYIGTLFDTNASPGTTVYQPRDWSLLRGSTLRMTVLKGIGLPHPVTCPTVWLTLG